VFEPVKLPVQKTGQFSCSFQAWLVDTFVGCSVGYEKEVSAGLLAAREDARPTTLYHVFKISFHRFPNRDCQLRVKSVNSSQIILPKWWGERPREPRT
jgi:hypothetical protein